MQRFNSGASALDRSTMESPPQPASRPLPSRDGRQRPEDQLGLHNANMEEQSQSSPAQQQRSPSAAEPSSETSSFVPHRPLYLGASSYPGLLNVKRSRSPQNQNAPPFQYRDPYQPFGNRFKSRPENVIPTSFDANSSSLNVGQHRFDLPRESPTPYSSELPTLERFPLYPERSFTDSSPQLVPPHLPAGYNPIANPYIPKSRSPPVKKKPSLWSKAKRKVSGKGNQSQQASRPRTPISRTRSGSLTSSPPGSRPSSPYFRPSPPTPSRGRSATHPQTSLSVQGFSDTVTRKENRTQKPGTGNSGKFGRVYSTKEEAEAANDEEAADEWEENRGIFVEGGAWQAKKDPRSISEQHQGPSSVENSGIYRDVHGVYRTVDQAVIPGSAFESSENSPIPRYLFEDNWETQIDQIDQSQGQDFTHHRRQQHSSRSVDRLKELYSKYPDQQLSPDTPKTIGRQHAYLALLGGLPEEGLCVKWDREVPKNSPTRQGGGLSQVGLEEQTGAAQSRGRRRAETSPPVLGEDLGSESGRTQTARRLQRLGSVRRDAREGVVSQFIVAQEEVDRVREREPRTSPKPQGVVVAAKREIVASNKGKRGVECGGVESLQAASGSKTPASGFVHPLELEPGIEYEYEYASRPAASGSERLRSSYANLPGIRRGVEYQEAELTAAALCSEKKYANPLEVHIWENKYKYKYLDENDATESIDGDILEDLPPPIPKKSAKRPAETFVQSSQQVSGRSETLAAKEHPVTPENKQIGSRQHRLEHFYSTFIYPRGQDESLPRPIADLRPSPLALKPKSPSIGSPAPSSPEELDPFRTTHALLDGFLSVSNLPPAMETLQISSALRSSTKTKAVEDAEVMQKSVIETCNKAGKVPPKYRLMELIGKGSFGRVYKGKDIETTKIVAVKIIDIDESDTLNPRLADTYSEFMKEVNALKILSESKAKNINLVIEALPVGKAMWMITEYCGGGSIATLMKPTPNGLKEKFIIPILRETAEAVKWVHQAGIIHRDLKCANILITEEGGVQLCDFGVAGIIETNLDKRSTFIGTFNWMAPELFQGSQYGKEVDIWAFGSMAYEMATGLPPNAMSGVTGMDLGAYLQHHIPRLVGGTYSDGLRDIVAYCLEENPDDRPTIEAVQRHNYISNTNSTHPASSLSDLVKAFKMWESHGGTRKSLFGAGGAQGPSELSSTVLSDDSWNFSTTAAFDQAVAQGTNTQDIINVYGASVTLGSEFHDETSRPVRQQQSRPTRRRPPPEALAPLKAPLEKLFDPNTMSNYEDNARSHYNQHQNNVSDLPLRDNSGQTSIRDTLIDLDAHEVPSGLSSFSDMETMKPNRRAYAQDDSEEEYESGGNNNFARPALSDPADNPNRRTQDWKFPVMAPPASANPEVSRFPVLQRPNFNSASGTRPALVHHPTEPISFPTQSSNFMPSAPGSPNRMSLIDLDLSLPEPSRPSTADSAASMDATSANPFHWERHASMYHNSSAREPSLYLTADSITGLHSRTGNTLQDLGEVSDFSASDAEGYQYELYNGHRTRAEETPTYDDAYFQQSSVALPPVDYEMSSMTPIVDRAALDATGPPRKYTMDHFPPLADPPSVAALSGTATQGEMQHELHRMFGGLSSQLSAFRDVYDGIPRRGLDKRDRGASGDER